MANTRRSVPAAKTGDGGVPELIVNQDRSHERGDRSVDDLDDDRRNEIYEAAKKADYEIPKLQAMPMSELIEVAHDAGLDGRVGLTKQELIFQILKRKVTSRGLGWGEGTLDILPDGFGFLRSRRYNYQAGPDDIYVSPSQIRRLSLRQGHQLAGPVRPPKDGEKYFALLHVEAVNGKPIEELRARIPFENLTPLLPSQRLVLEHEGCGLDVRLIDLLAPMGRGQRTLILSPPHSGRTVLLIHLAQAILTGNPDIYVILLLLDERPEEVTEAVRNTGPDTQREVVASTFDEPAARHVALAELAMMKARRMVEGGAHVAVLMDSLTSLTRAYNGEVPHSGKILSAGLDAAALQEPRRLFGAARSVEEGGSLTVIATSLTDTESHINDAICEEFKGKANCEITLDRELASLHIYPAIDICGTGTRREDSLLPAAVLAKLRRLRAEVHRESPRQALEQLVARVAASPDNRRFLDSL